MQQVTLFASCRQVDSDTTSDRWRIYWQKACCSNFAANNCHTHWSLFQLKQSLYFGHVNPHLLLSNRCTSCHLQLCSVVLWSSLKLSPQELAPLSSNRDNSWWIVWLFASESVAVAPITWRTLVQYIVYCLHECVYAARARNCREWGNQSKIDAIDSSQWQYNCLGKDVGRESPFDRRQFRFIVCQPSEQEAGTDTGRHALWAQRKDGPSKWQTRIAQWAIFVRL